MRAFTAIIVSFGLLIPLSGLAADPFRPSVKDQIRLGTQVAEEVRRKERMLHETDERLRLMRTVGNRLVATIEGTELTKNPWKFSFDVLNDPAVNAFALPGGPVFFVRGLLDRFSTEDQVAGVLAHEICHIRKQHWASAYADNQKRQLGLTALLLILRANRNAFDLASISDELIFRLPYSRKHESEADKVGFEMLVRAGYNPQGMIDTFKILAAAGGNRGGPEWMNTHPDNANRIKALEQMIVRWNIKFDPQKPLPARWFLNRIKRPGG